MHGHSAESLIKTYTVIPSVMCKFEIMFIDNDLRFLVWKCQSVAIWVITWANYIIYH